MGFTVGSFLDVGVPLPASTEMVLTGPLETFGFDFDETFGLGVALRALGRRILTLIDIATNKTSEFLFHTDISIVSPKDTILFPNTQAAE